MLVVWYMNGTTLINGAVIYQGVPLDWDAQLSVNKNISSYIDKRYLLNKQGLPTKQTMVHPERPDEPISTFKKLSILADITNAPRSRTISSKIWRKIKPLC